MTKGSSAITQDGQKVTILGFSNDWKPIDLLNLETKSQNEIVQIVENNLTLTQEELNMKAICLFHDK